MGRFSVFLRIVIAEILHVVELPLIDEISLGLVVPLNALSEFPKTMPFRSFLGIGENSETVLFSVVPVAGVFAPICPEIESVSFFLIIGVLAPVLYPVSV